VAPERENSIKLSSSGILIYFIHGWHRLVRSINFIKIYIFWQKDKDTCSKLAPNRKDKHQILLSFKLCNRVCIVHIVDRFEPKDFGAALLGTVK